MCTWCWWPVGEGRCTAGLHTYLENSGKGAIARLCCQRLARQPAGTSVTKLHVFGLPGLLGTQRGIRRLCCSALRGIQYTSTQSASLVMVAGLTSGAPLPQSTHSPPCAVLRICPASHVTSGFEDAFKLAGFTSGGTLKGNCCLHKVALPSRADRRTDIQSAVLLLDVLRPSLSASAQAENILGRAAAALGLHMDRKAWE